MAFRKDTRVPTGTDDAPSDATSTPDGTFDPPTEGTATSSPTPDSETSDSEPVRDYRGTGIIWAAVALVIAVALCVVIALQNTQDVEFSFLWFDVATPLILILAITFGIALVVGEVVGFVWRRRRRTRLRERDELRRLRKNSA